MALRQQAFADGVVWRRSTRDWRVYPSLSLDEPANPAPDFGGTMTRGRASNRSRTRWKRWHWEKVGSQILQELRTRRNAGHKQPISRTGAGDIKQLPLGLIDIVEFAFVGGVLNPRLQW